MENARNVISMKWIYVIVTEFNHIRVHQTGISHGMGIIIIFPALTDLLFHFWFN